MHFAVAPVGSVLLAAAVGADLVAVADFAAVVEASGAAGAAAAVVAALDLAAFCTPPWPLHVPLPVDVLVVPSAQVVLAPATGAAGVLEVAGAFAGAAAAAFCTPP